MQEHRSCARLLPYANRLDTCSSEQGEVRLELRFVSLFSEDRDVVSCFTRQCRVTSLSLMVMQQSCERLRHVVRAAEGQQSNGSPAHSKPPPQSDDGSGQQRERSRVVELRCVQSVILGPCRRTSGRQAPILRLAWTNRILYRNRGSAALPGRPQRATLFPSLPWRPQCTRSPGCLPETPPPPPWALEAATTGQCVQWSRPCRFVGG